MHGLAFLLTLLEPESVPEFDFKLFRAFEDPEQFLDFSHERKFSEHSL
jgi:hypothetical protein